MTISRSFVVAVRDLDSARLAFECARRFARSGDRIILLHVEHSSLLRLLGAGVLRDAMPDAPIANLKSTTWLEQLGRSFATDTSCEIEIVILETP